MLLVVAATAACGPVDRSMKRPLVIDETPLGTPRAEVKRWHLEHDWCEGRTWDASDEFRACQDGGSADGRAYSLFRFEGAGLVAAAVYTPVVCTRNDCRTPLGIDTELEGPPFVAMKEGLVATPTDAGREAAPDMEVPADQRRLLDALKVEIEARMGPPAWSNGHETAMVWNGNGEAAGLFLTTDAMWVVETHQAAAR